MKKKMITENSIIAIINRSTLKIIEKISINEFNFKYKNSKEIIYLLKIEKAYLPQPINGSNKIIKLDKYFFCSNHSNYFSPKLKNYFISNSIFSKENQKIYYSGVDTLIFVNSEIINNNFNDIPFPLLCYITDENNKILFYYFTILTVKESISENIIRFSFNSNELAGNYFIHLYVSGVLIFKEKIIFKKNNLYNLNKIK